MKSKFKDFLLYSLACVGAVSLFLSAYQPQQTISTVPESHVWAYANLNTTYGAIFNKQTGEIRTFSYSTDYEVLKEDVPKEKKKK